MAKMKNDLGGLFNPISLCLLAIALLALDVAANQYATVTSATETFTVAFSGVLFGLALGYTMIGQRRYNHSIAPLLLVVYVITFVVLYLMKWINV